MTGSVASPTRIGAPTNTGAPRPSGRHLVIEDLDATPAQGAALLSICIVAAPSAGAPVAPLRSK